MVLKEVDIMMIRQMMKDAGKMDIPMVVGIINNTIKSIMETIIMGTIKIGMIDDLLNLNDVS